MFPIVKIMRILYQNIFKNSMKNYYKFILNAHHYNKLLECQLR